MTTPLGYEPTKRQLVLSKGADFIQRILPDGTTKWPTNTSAKIEFYNATTGVTTASWNATVTPDKLEWIIQSTDADAIPARTGYRLYVSYPQAPTQEYVLFYGTVKRSE